MHKNHNYKQQIMNIELTKKHNEHCSTVTFFLPSKDIPLSRHSLNLQDLQRFLFWGVISHWPPKKHLYFSPRIVLLLKNPCEKEIHFILNVNVIIIKFIKIIPANALTFYRLPPSDTLTYHTLSSTKSSPPANWPLIHW